MATLPPDYSDFLVALMNDGSTDSSALAAAGTTGRPIRISFVAAGLVVVNRLVLVPAALLFFPFLSVSEQNQPSFTLPAHRLLFTCYVVWSHADVCGKSFPIRYDFELGPFCVFSSLSSSWPSTVEPTARHQTF